MYIFRQGPEKEQGTHSGYLISIYFYLSLATSLNYLANGALFDMKKHPFITGGFINA